MSDSVQYISDGINIFFFFLMRKFTFKSIQPICQVLESKYRTLELASWTLAVITLSLQSFLPLPSYSCCIVSHHFQIFLLFSFLLSSLYLSRFHEFLFYRYQIVIFCLLIFLSYHLLILWVAMFIFNLHKLDLHLLKKQVRSTAHSGGKNGYLS